MTETPATDACRTNTVFLIRLTLLFALTWASALAHDPSDITAHARLLPERIELQLTLAWSTASELLAPGKPAGVIRQERFDEIRPALQLRAAEFLTVTAGGKTLAPESVVAELSRDGDVKIRLQFPPVAVSPFRFDAPLLKTLPDGYTVFLFVIGPEPQRYVQARMTSEKSSYEINDAPR